MNELMTMKLCCFVAFNMMDKGSLVTVYSLKYNSYYVANSKLTNMTVRTTMCLYL